MSDKQLRQLIMLGVAGAAVYYLFFRSATPAIGPVTITPINPGLLPPPAQAASIPLTPGWLTA